jgi:hypothetical protein
MSERERYVEERELGRLYQEVQELECLWEAVRRTRDAAAINPEDSKLQEEYQRKLIEYRRRAERASRDEF